MLSFDRSKSFIRLVKKMVILSETDVYIPSGRNFNSEIISFCSVARKFGKSLSSSPRKEMNSTISLPMSERILRDRLWLPEQLWQETWTRRYAFYCWFFYQAFLMVFAGRLQKRKTKEMVQLHRKDILQKRKSNQKSLQQMQHWLSYHVFTFSVIFLLPFEIID